MASLLTIDPVMAEDTPLQDMDFFLFLADSIVNEETLVTPVDLQGIEVNETSNRKDNTSSDKEADNE